MIEISSLSLTADFSTEPPVLAAWNGDIKMRSLGPAIWEFSPVCSCQPSWRLPSVQCRRGSQTVYIDQTWLCRRCICRRGGPASGSCRGPWLRGSTTSTGRPEDSEGWEHSLLSGWFLYLYLPTHRTPTTVLALVSRVLHTGRHQAVTAQQVSLQALVSEKSELTFLTIERRSVVDHLGMNFNLRIW